jgi:hypothetical protein
VYVNVFDIQSFNKINSFIKIRMSIMTVIARKIKLNPGFNIFKKVSLSPLSLNLLEAKKKT